MNNNELKNKANEYYGKNAQSEKKPIAKLLGSGHKDFRYVGSTDNGHCDGEYGMDLSGWKKVDVDEVE